MKSEAKPCRVCDDFKTWNPTSAPVKRDRKECPLDSQELGRNTWSFIHTMAAYYKPSEENKVRMSNLINGIARFYPCSYCASHLQEYIVKNPPNLDSATLLSRWWCLAHNDVNARLGKPIFDCDRVMERWKDGCDD